MEEECQYVYLEDQEQTGSLILSSYFGFRFLWYRYFRGLVVNTSRVEVQVFSEIKNKLDIFISFTNKNNII